MSDRERKRRSSKSRQTGAPTIADVAARAGVSMMTVSRVINSEPKVRQSTRDAVNAAIAELNYAPNRAARSLAGAAQIRIGLLYSNPSEAFLSAFIVGSLEEAGRSDAQIIVQKVEDGADLAQATERMIAGGIDGIILPPPLNEESAVLEVLERAAIPTVAVSTARPREGVAAIMIDDRSAARELTAHLIGLGHQRVGFIAGHPDLSASGERLEGYREALAEAGIPYDESLVAQGYFTYRSGLDAAEVLLSLDNPPSAIFASNDDMAAATVAIAHRRGLDVPGDLTVCGFDDVALATTIWPELTTIQQPIAQMSRRAVELLVSLLRNKKQGEISTHRIVVDHKLVRRQSDAAPRRRPVLRVPG
ncbi:LacI family DNA-binding transcriptional regulator [Novosphingobium beihaiensis]|uniref:LacI family DNA-binding transcriptional regulator n=1 Tax=Novosphingobium beihaiensis TaxID=2930389 RepID=A0ABT0BQA5_9SPHN|nr:LacI family DNA-binding transcriptional regulator [Novosphingobium beihaiensis]MCJ2187206.1 LacI family DNA-binding transcriptional regulator [Novosphingobium beihaiensis]